MKTFSGRLEDLKEEAVKTLVNLVSRKGEESKHNSYKCLKVTDNYHNYNLDSGRYLSEVNADHLIDNSGYSYDFYCINDEEFFSLLDYLIAKYN